MSILCYSKLFYAHMFRSILIKIESPIFYSKPFILICIFLTKNHDFKMRAIKFKNQKRTVKIIIKTNETLITYKLITIKKTISLS